MKNHHVRRWLGAKLAALAWALPCALALPVHAADAPAGQRKVLHMSMSSPETSLDPARINDLYSRTITPHIFEALYGYDHLARPARIKPLLADGMPEMSADFKVFTVKVKRGIYFASDPAFKGVKREVQAKDFIYALQRIVDPANKSPVVASLLDIGMVGLKEARDNALKNKQPFDYDRVIPGLRALDSHTLRVELAEPRPRFVSYLAQSDLLGAQAREVVEFYGPDKVAEHPVGTGPFRLKQWRRSSLIVLERNPDFREATYEGEPAADDPAGQALLARFKGRRIPMVDEVRVSIIAESQPRWLAFLNGQVDGLVTLANNVPQDFVAQAMPQGKVAPNLAKRGVLGERRLNSDVTFAVFNMNDPVVGGYTAEKVALRRAIGLSYDTQREIQLIWRGNAVAAHGPVMPHTSGYDPHFKSEMGDYDPARAKALLDLYGYVDRDGDGWREQPDGSRLELVMATQPEQRARVLDELWQKSLKKIGIRVRFEQKQFAENLKAVRAGKLQFWQLGTSAAGDDGQDSLSRMYGPQRGSQNFSFFQRDEYDRIYDRMSQIQDGPERDKLFFEAKRIAVAYMPWKYKVHRMSVDVWHPWLVGYRAPQFWQEWFHMVDIDNSLRPPAR
jgi:ABC-type transport system substrate-binding protein